MAGMQRLRIAIVSLLLLVTACSDPIKQQIAQQLPITEQRVQILANMLNNDQIRNATLITQYAQRIKALKPDLTPIVDELSKDATTKGPTYLSLVDRINTVKTNPAMFASKQALYEELLNIYQAADPILFSDALSDPLNVLADMSDGQLPRVNALSKTQSLQANKAQDFGTGQQLIGNPQYGHWQTGNNGMSFWAWYGMYSMLGDVFGSRRVYYSRWSQGRDYSYYNDFGRTRYSSPNQLKQQTALDTRTKKSFANKGQRFTSAYSTNRSGASGLSRQSQSARVSANRFSRTGSTFSRSRYASSNRANKNASFRNSRTNTSRGFRRGK